MAHEHPWSERRGSALRFAALSHPKLATPPPPPPHNPTALMWVSTTPSPRPAALHITRLCRTAALISAIASIAAAAATPRGSPSAPSAGCTPRRAGFPKSRGRPTSHTVAKPRCLYAWSNRNEQPQQNSNHQPCSEC